MKILVVSHYWQPENGVPQRRWAWLCGLLREQGHQVTAVVPPPHYDRNISFSRWFKEKLYRPKLEAQLGSSGENIFRCGFFPSSNSLTSRAFSQAAVALGTLWMVYKQPGQLSDYRPDVVIGTVPALPTATVARLAARRFKCPYIIDLRDAWPDLLSQSDVWNSGMGTVSFRQRVLSLGPLQVVTWVTEKFLYRSLRDAAAVIATSSELARDLAGRSELLHGNKTPDVFTLRNTFPVAAAIPVGRANFEVQKEVSGKLHLKVLYAGTIGRAQDLRNAIKAVELAKQAGVIVDLRFVGSGAEKAELKRLSIPLKTQITFEKSHPADLLNEQYTWADSALVHLADWGPLAKTVPSKLYELMELGIHVSAAVEGEAADLVRVLGAGHVVPPNQPEYLAALWKKLARDRNRLKVSDRGRQWVIQQRQTEAPRVIQNVLNGVVKRIDEEN